MPSPSLAPRLALATALGLQIGGAQAAPPVADLGLLPGDASLVVAHSSQQDHAIARGADSFLLVWLETRAMNLGNATNESGTDIFGIRLDLAGQPIDSVPFVVHAGAGGQQRPEVSWNGSAWLVTFASQDPTPFYFQDNVRGVRVASDGTVLDPTPLTLVQDQQFWQVGGQAGQWLVTWTRYHANGYGTELVGRRLDGNGAFLDPAPIQLMDWIYLSNFDSVQVAANEYLVIGPDWNTNATKARRVGLNGQPIGAPFTLPGPAIASDGSEYFVAWLDQGATLRGSRMTSTGSLLTPAGTPIATGVAASTIAVAHDAAGGDQWWVGWSVANIIKAARVSRRGVVLDPGGESVPNGASGTNNNCYDMRLAPLGAGGVLVTWWDVRGSQFGDANVYGVPVSAANEPAAEYPLTVGRSSQRGPDFAEGPDGRMAIAFLSEAGFEDRVLVHLLDRDGTAISKEPIEIAAGPALGAPSIAWNGSLYLVAWNDTSVKARRLAPDGTLLDATPIEVMSGFAVGVGALGDAFLVAATRYGATPQTIFAVARRVDGPTGAVIDAASMNLGGYYVSTAPRVRSDGTRWMVAYHSNWSHDSPQSDPILNFVNANGTFTPGVNPTPFSGGGGHPDIASSGDGYLFVWRSNSLANANNFISGRILDANGAPSGNAFTVAEAPGRQLRPVADFDGSTYVVAWDDQRNQSSFFDERTDIYGARITTSGVVLDAPAFPILVGPSGDGVAAILGHPNGRTYVAGARFIPTPDFDAYRIGLARIGDPIPSGDLDGDGAIGAADLAILLGSWGVCDGCGADLDGSGAVDAADLALLLGAWSE